VECGCLILKDAYVYVLTEGKLVVLECGKDLLFILQSGACYDFADIVLLVEFEVVFDV
jgi:hypothetical protein